MNTSQHQAADAYLGYVHQGQLVVLLDADDNAVSVKTADDVELMGSTPSLYQLKHSQREKATLTLKNADLWKSIHIWAQDPLRISTTSFIFGSCLAKLLQECKLT